tara:strand:- start:451 stop:675 length:225 start_codon:yes stop_codon:yes gene_type:complete
VENINNYVKKISYSDPIWHSFILSGITMSQRKEDRKAAKKIIKLAKEHKGWYTDSDVRYAKMVKKRTKKVKKDD